MKIELLRLIDEQLNNREWRDISADGAFRWLKDKVLTMPERVAFVPGYILANADSEDPELIRCPDCINETRKGRDHFCEQLNCKVKDSFFCGYAIRRGPDEYEEQ